MYRKHVVVIALLVLFCLSVTSVWAGGSTESATQPAKLKSLTIGLASAITTIDPWNHRSSVVQVITQAYTDGFMDYSPDGSIILSLAESITKLDPLTFEVKLRKGVMFHDGSLMTADDVIFSINRAGLPDGMDGKKALRNLGVFKSIEKVDDYTVIVRATNASWSATSWTNYEVFPKKYFEQVGGIEGFLKKPMGVGPFKWVEGDINSPIVFERFENYWGGPKLPGEVSRIPALDRVIFIVITEPATRVSALLSGEVDIIQAVPADSVQLLLKNPNINVASTPGTGVKHLNFNVNKPPFNDKRVRQALAYAIDYDSICNDLLLGFSSPMYGRPYLEPYREGGLTGFSQDTVKHLLYKYDPEKAKALLKEAGYSTITTVIDTIPGLEVETQAIAQMLTKVGIDASVRVWDFSVIHSEFKKGGRDLLYLNRGQSGRSPSGFNNSIGTGMNYNYSGYSNPVYDKLIKDALAMGDGHSPERTALFMKSYEIGLDDLPALWIHNPHIVEASRSHVKNFFPEATSGRLNLQRLDIE